MQLSRYRFYSAIFVSLISLILLLSSCKLPFVPENQEPSVEESYEGKKQLKFSALKATNNDPYSVQAVLLAENNDCIVYGDYAAKISLSTAEEIAREYAEHIAPSITGVFGKYYPSNKKLIILLLDIIDGYDSKRDTTYVAGYFSVKDIFPKSRVSNSNEAPMLYIDINPGKPGDSNFYPTIAHELQHLINFSSRYRSKESELENEPDPNTVVASIQQDEWVDEGLSSAAEYIYSNAVGKNKDGNGHIRDKVDYYNKAKDYYDKGQSRIAWGNNFFTWGENNNFIYDEYVTVYLFFQWLRIQANDGTNIYRSIVESEYTDYRAVTAAARNHIPRLFEGIDSSDDQTKELELLLETWFAANYVNVPKKEMADGSGIFGYNDEITLTPVMLSGESVPLYPGEGVYSKLGGEIFLYPPKSPAHIRYAGLNKTENPLIRITPENSGRGDALLTFNANHDTTAIAGKPASEPGTLAGVEAAPEEPSPSGRAADMPAKPFPIDIRPPLRF
ncbi:MAG: hypothetical protein LBB83_01730 [Treponema sp.]|nr:hypothetical protein [Treponema sp.]